MNALPNAHRTLRARLGAGLLVVAVALLAWRFGKPIIWPEDSRLVRDNSTLKLVIAPPNAYYREDDPVELLHDFRDLQALSRRHLRTVELIHASFLLFQ